MKTIGLIGGMSWESSVIYYQLINREIRDRFGGLSSANIVMHSLNFAEIEEYQRTDQWKKATKIIGDSAMCLDVVGAHCVVICSVTGHEGTDKIQKRISIPIIHIADCINEKIKGMKKVGLLGTIHTMEKKYFKGRINAKVIIPNKEDRKFVSDVTYYEIDIGIISEKSRQRYIEIINKLEHDGAEGVILGCTEIPLLIQQEHVDIPVFDSITIHAKAAVDFALGEEG